MIQPYSLDEHMDGCVECASADEPCEVGVEMMEAEHALDEPELLTGADLATHKHEYHDPRNLEHEPCCSMCCDCASTVAGDEAETTDGARAGMSSVTAASFLAFMGSLA